MEAMNKKIITCAPLPPPHGGIANWYDILLSEGRENGYTFLNVNTSPRKSIGGRTLFYRVFVQGWRMLGQRKELAKLIKQNKDVRVAHITTSGSLALIRDILILRLLKRKGLRSIYHIHFGRIPEIFEKKGMEYHLVCKALSLASDVIAIDPKTYEILRKKCSSDMIHYIPNPVRRVSVDRQENTRNVIFLGNVLRTKGVEELLLAWARIFEEYPEWTLTVAGTCEETYKEFLEGKYSLENVKMLGYVPHDEAMNLLGKSDLLVLPSYTEGFPNVIIEAMMCGKAVVATDVGAISDILSGGCGMVIAPKNVGELYDSIEKIITEPSLGAQMGRRGREKALECYVSDVVFSRYIALWEKGQST